VNNDSKDRLVQAIIETIKEKNPQTTRQLVNLVKGKSSASDQEILDTILRLQDEERIKLATQPSPVPPKLATYLETEQTFWYWTTIAIAIATTIAVFTIPEDFYPWVYARYFLGTIFVIWLPGYAFIKALFPTRLPIKTSQKSLDTIELIALSIGMSLALVPIVGLLLNYTPWGIRLTPIVLSLLTLTVVFATAGIVREHQAKINTEK
jgi:hypothetical protein